jgi:hypothetical protein
MKIPYVIDNQKHKLSDILNAILDNHQGQSMDVVTAYFNIQGYNLLKEGLSLSVVDCLRLQMPILVIPAIVLLLLQ